MKKRTKILLAVLIYLSGYFVSYNTTKYTYETENPNRIWTNEHRVFALTISLLSWGNVIAMGIILSLDQIDKDKPVNW